MAEAKKILVVEDEPDLAEMIRTRLTLEGYQVEVAHDGAEGLKKIQEAKYDLVTLNVIMPGLSGYEVCKAIKQDERLKHIPVMMLTVKSEPVDKAAGQLAGADDYLVKPYDRKELVTKVRALLAKGGK